jgi:hypothetical protein
LWLRQKCVGTGTEEKSCADGFRGDEKLASRRVKYGKEGALS